MSTERAILAGGCFWGMEALIRREPGVIDTEVGYTGGELKNPTYADMRTGKTGHAEAIEVTFDPSLISYRQLLALFFQIHDPSTPNRQGNDIGTQYRSAIFYINDAQKAVAEEVIRAVDASGLWPGKAVTQLVLLDHFYPAEDYHQDYLELKPDGYTCHFPRKGWVLPPA